MVCCGATKAVAAEEDEVVVVVVVVVVVGRDSLRRLWAGGSDGEGRDAGGRDIVGGNGRSDSHVN